MGTGGGAQMTGGGADPGIVETPRDFIDLGEAALVAIDAGVPEEAFVAALRTGAVDTVLVGGRPYVSQSELGLWCRFRDHVRRGAAERGRAPAVDPVAPLVA